jgi:hypothetical protein
LVLLYNTNHVALLIFIPSSPFETFFSVLT